jgi:hypothetical protein
VALLLILTKVRDIDKRCEVDNQSGINFWAECRAESNFSLIRAALDGVKYAVIGKINCDLDVKRDISCDSCHEKGID